MFSRFRKDGSDSKETTQPDSSSIPENLGESASRKCENPEAIFVAENELAESETAPDGGDHDTERQPSESPGAQSNDEPNSATPVAKDSTPEPEPPTETSHGRTSEERKVLGELLELFGEFGRNSTPEERDAWKGLSVDVPLSVDSSEETQEEPIFDPSDEAGEEESVADSSSEELSAVNTVEKIPFSPTRRRQGRRLEKPSGGPAKKPGGKVVYTPEQRLLLLDTWLRSGLSAGDFASLVGISKHTLFKWKRLFRDHGPEGLNDQPPKKKRGSQLHELTRRAILMMKEANPDWGCRRIADMLVRGPAMPASPAAVARVLKEAGYELFEEPTRPHPPKVRRFERAKPNQLWQTDLFTFTLKRQNRRLYLVAFMDDHSRFIVSYGLTASATTAQVIEILEAGIASHGVPEEVLTDNGPQYVTWRGKSRFTKHLEKRGIRQIVARPKRPQTLGKIERFWGTMWREFLEAAIFTDLEDARRRIGLFIDNYNFNRVHRGIDGLVPADRFFRAAPEVLRTLKERVAANALQMARHGVTKKPFYVTGQVDGQAFSVHSEGERLILRRDGRQREEVELTSPPEVEEPELPMPLCADGSLSSAAGEPAELPAPAPGESALDDLMGFSNDGSADESAADGSADEESAEENPSAEGGEV